MAALKLQGGEWVEFHWTPVAPRFLADTRAWQLLREAGFEQYWRVKGWPALCRLKGATDFECGNFVAKAP